uniref:Secreted protein n=1 Tax=Brassica oleracea TaxID=3712 RepID=A0A3P6G4B1_BRAOL|nr:unnamed protein product [Brassica oleracea]
MDAFVVIIMMVFAFVVFPSIVVSCVHPPRCLLTSQSRDLEKTCCFDEESAALTIADSGGDGGCCCGCDDGGDGGGCGGCGS